MYLRLEEEKEISSSLFFYTSKYCNCIVLFFETGYLIMHLENKQCGVATNIVKTVLREVFIFSGIYISLISMLIISLGYNAFLIAYAVLLIGIALLITLWWSVSRILKNDIIFNCLNKSAAESLKALSMKMDIVKNLQFFAEPTKDSITSNPELQFLYKMIPADYISGDIFGIHTDSARNASLFWVGDVIGHGIGAGLIMVAIQSIIQTLIVKSINEELKDILIKLNNILYDVFDIHLRDSAYQTSFILLKYMNNSIKFVGQHENIIHYNFKRNIFSIIDTSDYGINLGSISSTENIEKFIEYGIFEFARGDSLILYSDGVIEALNDNGEMYGLYRLMKSLETNIIINKEDRTKDDILDKILTDLKIWAGPKKFTDDITLIIINNKGIS